MNEKPEALADRLDDERMNLIERLADENERLRKVLLCLVEACTDEGVRCMDNLLASARAALRREET